MTDGVDADVSELLDLAADLGEVASNAPKHVRAAVEDSSEEIRDSAREKVGGSKHFAQAARTIGFDVRLFQGFGASVLQSDIGYDKRKPAGKLGNIREFGAPGAANALAPSNDLQRSMAEHADDFHDRLDKALEDAEREAFNGSSPTRVAASILRGGS